MRVVFASMVLLLGIQSVASAGKVTVNCKTPSMMAGGANMTLTGELQIVVSPTTGMTKIKSGSYLTVTSTKLTGAKAVSTKENILVSGTLHAGSSVKIAANQEPSSNEVDDRTYSEITIDGKNSSIFELKGSQRHPLVCAEL